MLRQKPCRSHRKPRRNPPNTAPPRDALVGLKIDNRTSPPGCGLSDMKKWCAIAICAIALSLPSRKAESIGLVEALTLASAGLNVLSKVVDLLDSGANPMALRVDQTYNMVTALHDRLNKYDVVLTDILRNIENIPKIMSEVVRREISDETARVRREMIKARVDAIKGNIMAISMGGGNRIDVLRPHFASGRVLQ